MLELLKIVDKANGFTYGFPLHSFFSHLDRLTVLFSAGNIEMPKDKSLMDLVQSSEGFDYNRTLKVQEKYMKSTDDIELEMNQIREKAEAKEKTFERNMLAKRTREQQKKQDIDKIASKAPKNSGTTIGTSHSCAHCCKVGATKRCSKCKSKRFCDNVCFRKGWLVHKKTCKDPSL